jgi:hypothetical protein
VTLILQLTDFARFVRILEEPPFYRHPGLDLVLGKLGSLRDPKSLT